MLLQYYSITVFIYNRSWNDETLIKFSIAILIELKLNFLPFLKHNNSSLILQFFIVIISWKRNNSRWSKWSFSDEKDVKCGSKAVRHGVCLLGIEDFEIVAKMPNIMFNKVHFKWDEGKLESSQMMPTFDYSIVECTAELLYNRTFLGQEDLELEEEYYENMVNVRIISLSLISSLFQVIYHKQHEEPKYELNCTPGYELWNQRKYPMWSFVGLFYSWEW